MQKPSLGELQLEILRFLTEHRPLSVGEVAERFGEPRRLARTTVLTVMERLREKGYLSRVKAEGVYRYQPYAGKAVVLRDLVHQFVETALEGSVSPFLAYLTQEKELTKEEIETLRQLLAEAAGETKEQEG